MTWYDASTSMPEDLPGVQMHTAGALTLIDVLVCTGPGQYAAAHRMRTRDSDGWFWSAGTAGTVLWWSPITEPEQSAT